MYGEYISPQTKWGCGRPNGRTPWLVGGDLSIVGWSSKYPLIFPKWVLYDSLRDSRNGLFWDPKGFPKWFILGSYMETLNGNTNSCTDLR